MARAILLLAVSASLFAQREWNKPFPAHKVIGNVYSIGTAELSTFLITTSAGHILINSDFESTVPQLRANIEKLGFKISDIKIILGSHAHRDHMEADAMLKGLTGGAQVMALEQDVPLLRRMALGEPHPIDKVLKDGDEVKLGGTTLKAHLTAGHTNGCTTWSMKASEGGKSYDVVIVCSVGYNPGYLLWKNASYPLIADDYRNSFKKLRALKCDIFLGAHPQFYDGEGKYARIGKGPNPFIDPAGYKAYVDEKGKAFNEEFERQKRANP